MKNKFLEDLSNIVDYKESSFLLAVSGGVDSMVLLNLFTVSNSSMPSIKITNNKKYFIYLKLSSSFFLISLTLFNLFIIYKLSATF